MLFNKLIIVDKGLVKVFNALTGSLEGTDSTISSIRAAQYEDYLLFTTSEDDKSQSITFTKLL